jgi:hypothetical protein
MTAMKTPIKAIRAYCIECSGDSLKEVRECPIVDCPLHPYRMGRKQTKTANRGAISTKEMKGGTQ